VSRVRTERPLGIAQRGPMRWIDSIEPGGDDPSTAWGSALIRKDNPLLRSDGSLDPLAHIELVAQTAAAFEAAGAMRRGEPPQGGALVGVTGFALVRGTAPGARLTVGIERTGKNRFFRDIEGRVFDDEELVASGAIRIFVDSEPHEGSAPVVSELDASSRPSRASMFPLEPRSVSREARKVCLGRFDATFPPFVGHFPGRPILPGVAIIALAVESCRQLCGQGSDRVPIIGKARFGRAILPATSVDVELEAGSGEGGSGSFSASVLADGKRAASVSFVL